MNSQTIKDFVQTYFKKPISFCKYLFFLLFNLAILCIFLCIYITISSLSSRLMIEHHHQLQPKIYQSHLV